MNSHVRVLGKLKERWLRLNATLLMMISLLTYQTSLAQAPDKVPDGTMGETLDVINDTTQVEKSKRWRLFNGRISTFKFGGGFLYEFAAYSQDDAARKQMEMIGTKLEPAFKVRDFRFFASGQFKTKRTITWKAAGMYDGATDTWLVRESGIMVGVPELAGHIFIGRTKEGFSLNKVMNGYAGWTMERQMALDVIPILADGIKWLGFLPKSRVLWNIGVFTDWFSEGQAFSTFKAQFDARVGWLPVRSEKEKKLLHVGASFRHGNPNNGQLQVRSRPEANPAPYFIDTGKFPVDFSNQIGGEIYYSKGPLMVGSEVYSHTFHSDSAGSPTFYGGEAVFTYIFTGESRPYNTVSGIYGFVPVTKPLFKGGYGTIEGVLRYSTLDLNGGTISGGKFWRITPMVNWYMTNALRLELAYGYGMLDRFNLQGVTQFYQARIQIAVL